MISPKKFERINGHTPALEHNGGGWMASCECHCDGEVKVLLSDGETEQEALAGLLREVYIHHRYIVCMRAGWKCEECGRVTEVTAHHKVLRSKGRDDTVTNLECRCRPCHDRSHGR